MRLRLALAAIGAVILAGAALGACGDDDDGSPARTVPDGASDARTAPESGDEPLADLVARSGDARVRVVYEVAGRRVAVSRDGAGRTAFAVDGQLGITTPDGIVLCEGIDTGTPSCRSLPAALAEAATFGIGAVLDAGDAIVRAAAQASGERVTDDRIAGREARCVEADASAVTDLFTGGAEAAVRVCADAATGVLLELSAGDSSVSLRAVEVGEPRDTDFVPPVAPTASPGTPGDEIGIDDLLEMNS